MGQMLKVPNNKTNQTKGNEKRKVAWMHVKNVSEKTFILCLGKTSEKNIKKCEYEGKHLSSKLYT